MSVPSACTLYRRRTSRRPAARCCPPRRSRPAPRPSTRRSWCAAAARSPPSSIVVGAHFARGGLDHFVIGCTVTSSVRVLTASACVLSVFAPTATRTPVASVAWKPYRSNARSYEPGGRLPNLNVPCCVRHRRLPAHERFTGDGHGNARERAARFVFHDTGDGAGRPLREGCRWKEQREQEVSRKFPEAHGRL